ncbi:MAG: sigma-54 dependent transcriptional regulator [Candidatus Krumholzibacteriia bacterium]
MSSFLNILCEACGAERVRMRVAVADGGRTVIVLDQRMPAVGLAEHAGCGADCGVGCGAGAQLPLLDLVSGSFDRFASGPRDSYSICGEAAMTSGPLIESDGPREWKMRRSVNGFDIEVDLVFGGTGEGFINDRVSKASAFLDLFESLLDGGELPERRADDACAAPPRFDPPFIGESIPMIELKRMIALVAASDVSLLIEGESGTGKEVVARNVHSLSRRRAKPLVIASSLELPHSLLQSELFGHAEGAFTGASRERAGLIESAAGGTFFLDEIGEMPLALQAALLRVLQEKEVRRLGESRRRPVDVRFVFATNRDLLDLAKKGRFRKDLYYRIAGVRLRVPPLRARKEDVIPLASFFLARCVKRAGGRVPAIAPAAVRTLVRYHWPGNVRELGNEVERLVAFHGDAGTILPRMLSPHLEESDGKDMGAGGKRSGSMPDAVRMLEKAMIADALRRFAGNRTRAAGELGITRQGLLKKLKRYGKS